MSSQTLNYNEENLITFVLVDSNDLEVTGLGGTFVLQLAKGAGAFAASAGTKGELGNGWYYYQTTVAECNTEGPLSVVITGAGIVQQNLAYFVSAPSSVVPVAPGVPLVLDDDAYVTYGGQTGTSSPTQRQIAYQVAESLAEEELGAYLVPTTITGSFSLPLPGRTMMLPKKYVQSIESVMFVHSCYHDCTLDECSGCGIILNGDAGIIAIQHTGWWNGCSCGCGYGGHPVQAKVVYTSGLPPHIRSDSKLWLALVIVAEIILQQMTDPAAALGGPGDPGIKSWSNMRYRQENIEALKSRFGSSPRANFASNLLRGIKKIRAPRL